MTGRGAGLSDAGLARKIDAIRRGIACNHPTPLTPWTYWASWAALISPGCAGCFWAAHWQVCPVLMDGFISGVAALCACGCAPAAAKAVFASHCSTEPAAQMVLEALGKAPLLTAGAASGPGHRRGGPASRCGHGAGGCTTAVLIPLRRAALRRTRPNADAGYWAALPAAKANTPRALCCAVLRRGYYLGHHAGVGCRVRRPGGKTPRKMRAAKAV